MEYHNPKSINKKETNKLTHQIGNVGHIALKVNNIDEAFAYLKLCKVELISNHPEYKPYKIDNITANEFKFFNNQHEENLTEKQNVCDIIGNIKYFYFIDNYGIQWELEQGHNDIGESL